MRRRAYGLRPVYTYSVYAEPCPFHGGPEKDRGKKQLCPGGALLFCEPWLYFIGLFLPVDIQPGIRSGLVDGAGGAVPAGRL